VVEQVTGRDHVLNHLSIPAACFTHPEISMVGLTEVYNIFFLFMLRLPPAPFFILSYAWLSVLSSVILLCYSLSPSIILHPKFLLVDLHSDELINYA